jgi:MATE family multidrug resistance protein
MNFSLQHDYDFLLRFFNLAITNILASLMEPLAGIISLAFLGHLSQLDHLTGSTEAGMLFDYLYFSAYFLRQGITGITAQAVGRDDQEQVLLSLVSGSCMALGLGILLLLLQYPLQEIWFTIVNSNPEDKIAAVAYFNARIWSAPAVLLNFVLIGWLFGREESRKVLVLTLVGSTLNILLDYIFIARLDWGSMGAGLSLAITPYLVFFLGLILISSKIQWLEFSVVLQKVFNWSFFQSLVTLNGNIFLTNFLMMSILTFFRVVATTMEKSIFAEDILLLQVVVLVFYVFEGMIIALESLVGNFAGKQQTEKLLPLLASGMGFSMILGLSFALACVLFPQIVFGLLTNHTEITESIGIFTTWLIPVLVFSGVCFMEEGYYLGLAKVSIIKNMTIIAMIVGFIPLAVAAWKLHNNHLLWLSLSIFLMVRLIGLTWQLAMNFKEDQLEYSNKT